MKTIEVDNTGNDVTDYNKGYRKGFEDAKKTLRDEFAAKAMQGLVSRGHEKDGWSEGMAEQAFYIAKTMLKARGECK